MSVKILLVFYQVVKQWGLGKNTLEVTKEKKETEYYYIKQAWEIRRLEEEQIKKAAVYSR